MRLGLLIVTVSVGWGLTGGAAGQVESAPADAPVATSTSKPGSTQPATPEKLTSELLSSLRFRSVGPGLKSGRIGDLAVHPRDRSTWYVAVASGNVWKTTNAGVTWEPIFDSYGSYSIGCVTIDPQNPNVVWVGTGENNSQRSVGYGDGVYRSLDGGQSFQHMGLRDSEHIGMIAIDPTDSNVVYVAAQGPLWRSGNDRGLYKTTNGGQTWTRILHAGEDTGVNEVHMDPRDPNILYASAYQRRRHVWTLVNGGPDSALYKSVDAGRNWRKLTSGLPGGDKGRIGLTIAPSQPDTLYAIVEAEEDSGGVFRSDDRGETWRRTSTYMSSSPQYYNELVCDPRDPNHVYSLDTFLHESVDGGRSFRRVPIRNVHVDFHALWINPLDTRHLIGGNDGGVYETFDSGQNWRFIAHNLPVTQFYRVTVDNTLPFYYIYGGTQDNNTLGGPSRTTERIGIANEHWFVTVGGDGFETQVDPVDPNIVYSQWQHGGLVRYDRASGETVDIKPREKPGEAGYRWNWDSPLLISPHSPTRLYFGCNILFRSDDRGDSWTAVSGDLTRQIDRNTLEVMGRIQRPEAVALHNSTSLYGNLVALSESPLVEGLLYVGADDGLIQVSEDGGRSWRKVDAVRGVPDLSYVSDLLASQHDPNRVYAAFSNHKMGDFKPYVYRSDDRGQTWTAISGDLPERDVVWALAEDHVLPQLLFVGTEFGAYTSVQGGDKWLRLRGGLPTIAVRDIDIQRRENDLVLGTFGRGFYVLDDYTPLRLMTAAQLDLAAHVFPVKDALLYVERNRLGNRDGRGWQGASFFATRNPPFGAVFTYHLKEKLKTRRERRLEEHKKAGAKMDFPAVEDFRAEDEERAPQVFMVIRDAAGETVRRVSGSRDKGLHRMSWNLRYPDMQPIRLSGEAEPDPWDDGPAGPLVTPGVYTATLMSDVDGVVAQLAEPVSFNVVALDLATLAARDKAAVLAFQQKLARLQRAVIGALRASDEAQSRISHIRKAVVETPAADPALLLEVDALNTQLGRLLIKLRGDRTLSSRDYPAPPSIAERVNDAVFSLQFTTQPPTQTQRDAYDYAGTEFKTVLAELRTLVTDALPKLEARLEAAGAPWTPGRVPDWDME